jgi:peptidoglycan hydrolase CwlO-like protein
MRLFAFILVVSLVFFTNCKKTEVKDTGSIDSLVVSVDSLLHVIEFQSQYTSDHFYALIDDSLKIASLTQRMDIPDSLGFYQFLEQNINSFNELILETKSEIFFAKDQLNSLKSEIKNRSISITEYEQEMKELREMILFLENRIDSNIYIIDYKFNSVFFVTNDSVI